MQPYPRLNKSFELRLNGAAYQPLEMVGSFGYNPEGWQHQGKTVTGPTSGRFKLIQVGKVKNWRELKRKLKAKGKIPAGQWLEAFIADFPKHDGQGPVGVADASWVSPTSAANFPCVVSHGGTCFRCADRDFRGNWRWLVASLSTSPLRLRVNQSRRVQASKTSKAGK